MEETDLLGFALMCVSSRLCIPYLVSYRCFGHWSADDVYFSLIWVSHHEGSCMHACMHGACWKYGTRDLLNSRFSSSWMGVGGCGLSSVSVCDVTTPKSFWEKEVSPDNHDSIFHRCLVKLTLYETTDRLIYGGHLLISFPNHLLLSDLPIRTTAAHLRPSPCTRICLCNVIHRSLVNHAPSCCCSMLARLVTRARACRGCLPRSSPPTDLRQVLQLLTLAFRSVDLRPITMTTA